MFLSNPVCRSTLRYVQDRLLKLLGYSLPSFFGVGSFPMAGTGFGSLQYGILPCKHPLTVIVGKPIAVPKCGSDPAPELVNDYHEKYILELADVQQVQGLRRGTQIAHPHVSSGRQEARGSTPARNALSFRGGRGGAGGGERRGWGRARVGAG